jgi:hypothetical protein
MTKLPNIDDVITERNIEVVYTFRGCLSNHVPLGMISMCLSIYF